MTDKITTERELELIDGMIEVQLHHAAQCDGIANRNMAEKQKAWDMERVALLRKMRAALAQQGEPVGEVFAMYGQVSFPRGKSMIHAAVDRDKIPLPGTKLYTAPPAPAAVPPDERVRVLREALEYIENVMGPTALPCCEGCRYEWLEALATARKTLEATK